MTPSGTIPLNLLPNLFAPLADHIRCALFVVEILRDDSGKLQGFVGRVANQDFCKLLSVREEDLLGKNLSEFLCQTLTLPELLRELALSGATPIHRNLPLGPGRTCAMQTQLPCPDLLSITIPVTQSDNQAILNAQAEVILAGLGDPCTIIDRNFSIIYENESARKLWGSNRGKTCYTVYHGLQGRCESCHSAEVFTDGQIHKNEKLARINGNEHHLEITSAPLKDDTGKVTAVVNITRDVSSRKMAEMGKEHLIRELQASLTKTKRLHGLLPVCSYCKKIKDNSGTWQQMESYLRRHAEVEFSHGICPECGAKHHPQIFSKKE